MARPILTFEMKESAIRARLLCERKEPAVGLQVLSGLVKPAMGAYGIEQGGPCLSRLVGDKKLVKGYEFHLHRRLLGRVLRPIVR